jgi:hypothetical protein
MKLRPSWGKVLVIAWTTLWCTTVWSAPSNLPDPKKVHALVQQLDSNRFAVRRRADKKLRQLGKAALPLFLREHKAATSLEVRRRLEKIIAPLLDSKPILLAVRNLGDARFAMRERVANRTLEACRVWLRYGRSPIPLLRQIQAGSADPEIEGRLELLIKKLR